MSTLLITPSLLDSYKWLKECPESWKEKASTDFGNTLRRIFTGLNPAVRRGLDFEKAICSSFCLPRAEFAMQFGEVAAEFHDKCAEGKQQVVFRKTVTVDGQPFLLYGRADVVLPGKIIDIKTTMNWKGAQSYLSKNQHLLYMAASGIQPFEYLVGVFDNEGDLRPAEVRSVMVEGVTCADAEERVKNSVRELMVYLAEHPDLEKAYRTIFNR